MMDRNHADELPKMQCGFIDFVCSFVYKVPTYKYYLLLMDDMYFLNNFLMKNPFLPLFGFLLCVCRSLRVSTMRYNPCSPVWITTGENGKLSLMSTRPRWRRSRKRRKGWKGEMHKVSANTWHHIPPCSFCMATRLSLSLSFVPSTAQEGGKSKTCVIS